MGMDPAFEAHLRSGTTRVCRAWSVVRKDGETYGFTDHDCDLVFDGITFRADTGLGAGALQQATGLAVDNTEAVGILSDTALREEDIQAGRFDDAEVRAWLVNWKDVSQRHLQFRGHLGEMTRNGGAFSAELRGVTEKLNQPHGRIYQSPCSAILGDGACQVDLSDPGYFFEGEVGTVEARKYFRFDALDGFEDRWFEGGRAAVVTGAAAGLVGLIKNDRLTGDGRSIELWEALAIAMAPGDVIRFEAGCDKRTDTCRLKFNNIVNFQGFPHIPGEDWLMAYPSSGRDMDGGSLEGEDFA